MQVERWATTSDALSNQPGNPTSILRVSGLPSPCTEQPVLMKAAGLPVSAPAEASRLVLFESGTACPAAREYMGTLAPPHVLSSGWLVAEVPVCGPHVRPTQTCSTTPHWDLQPQRNVER